MTLSERLRPLVRGWEDWVHDQLDGTSMVQEQLEIIKIESAQTAQQIEKDIEQIVGEVDHTNCKMASEIVGREIHTAPCEIKSELRQKLKEYMRNR